MPDATPATAVHAPTKGQVFVKRLRSTVVLWGLVAAAIVFATSWLFFVLLGVLGMAASIELARMDAQLPAPWRRLLIALAAVWTAATFTICQVTAREWPLALDAGFVAFVGMAAFVPAFFRPLDGRATLSAMMFTIAGFVLVPWMWSFMTRLLFVGGMDAGSRVAGVPLLLFVVVVTKMTDSGAYAIGSLIGKRKMVPRISPGKTWEGLGGAFIGAVAGGMAVYFGYGGERMRPLTAGHALGLSLLLGAVCIAGDLAESVIKRCLGAKDSGRVLPGIGGALDLIDSLLWTAPVCYFYLRYVCGAA